MLAKRYRPIRWPMLLGGILAACLLPAMPVLAQSDNQGDNTGSGYRIGEKTPTVDDQLAAPEQPDGVQANPASPADQKTQGPVRMARFAFVNGNVTWRTGDGAEWTKATVNLPLRQGAQLWVTDGGRADVQFDDGSELRLGNGAVANLKVLYSDAKGEFTQITLTDGLATLRTRREDSVYQVDTPLASVKSVGDSQIRFGVDTGTEVAVQRGSATIEGMQGKTTLHEATYLDLPNADAPYKAIPAPPQDSWDRWNAERNRLIDTKSETSRHLPPNISIAAGDLDSYGVWRDDPRYGWVWVPNESSPDWRPYHDGSWTWVEPFGWTWVGNEPWGWAPYHYGTWVNQPYGWAWCPGPAYQYWSPGVVGFSVYAGNVGWAPLCPWEVVYPPAFGLGFWGDNWFFSFSIGWCGCYYPWGGGFWRPWGNYFVNRWGYDHWGYGHFGDGHFGDGHFGNGHFGDGHNGLAGNHGFVPYNASHAAGATMASTAAFGGRGAYQSVPRGQTAIFARGQSVGAPAAGHAPTSGPGSVQPTRESTTPTRSFVSNAHPSQAVTQRSTYSAKLPASVQRSEPASTAGRNAGATAAQARASMGISGSQTQGSRTAVNSGASRTGGLSTAAEAARQARASLGYTGRSASAGGSSYGGRYGGSSYGGGYDGRSSGYSGSSGHSYGSGGNYHINESYGGSRGGGGGSSGGGGSRGGGGGGGGRGR